MDVDTHSPEPLLGGLNRFLAQLGITFRRDPNNLRPRINKLNSQKDAEQKASGNYFFLEDAATTSAPGEAGAAAAGTQQQQHRANKRGANKSWVFFHSFIRLHNVYVWHVVVIPPSR